MLKEANNWENTNVMMLYNNTIRRWWLLFPLSIFIILLARTFLVTIEPSLKPAWGDEYFNLYQVDHSTFSELRSSLDANWRNSPWEYFVALWGISKIFGCSILTMRLVSALCCAGGLCFIWATIRKFLSFYWSSLAVSIIFLQSELFLRYSAEARFYGPYFLGISMGVYCYSVLCSVKKPKISILIFNVLAQAVAVSSCYFGGLYSFLILVSILIVDLKERVFRTKVYLSYIIGWIPLLSCLDNILKTGNGATFSKVDRYSLLHPFDPGIDIGRMYYIIFFLSVIMLIYSLGQADKIRSKTFNAFPTLLLMVLFLLAPYVGLCISWLGVSVTVDRYYISSLFALSIMLGMIFSVFFRNEQDTSYSHKIIPLSLIIIKLLLLVVLVFEPLITVLHLKRNQQVVEDTPSLPNNIIIVADNWPTYLPLSYKMNPSKKPYFVNHTNDQLLPQDAKKYNSAIKLINFDDLVREQPLIIIAEDAAYTDFFWLKAALINRGYHIKNIIYKNKNVTWSLLEHS